MQISGDDLRAAREAAGIGLREMAEIVGRSAGHLSLVENNKRAYTPALVAAYERLLGGTKPQRKVEPESASLNDVKRRDLLGLVATASVGAATPAPVEFLLDALPKLALARRVGDAEVHAIEQAASLYMQMDLAHGGGIAAQMGQGSLHYAAKLLDQEMSAATRARLSSAVGLLADRLGWSAYDAGESGTAKDLLAWALNHAAQGSDHDLRAHIMLDLSTVLTDTGHPTDGVETLRMALGDDRISAAERANLHAVCARHCGTAGDRRAGLRHVRLAEEALAAADDANSPAWAQRVTVSPGHHHSAMGLALFELGDDAGARTHLSSALERLGGRRLRTGLRCRARLAIIYLRAGDRQVGEDEARRTLRDAVGVRSKRITADLHMLGQEADRLGYGGLAAEVRASVAA